MYNFLNFNPNKTKNKTLKFLGNTMFLGILNLFLGGMCLGIFGTVVALSYFPGQTQAVMSYLTEPILNIPGMQSLSADAQTQIQRDVYKSDVSYEQSIINTVNSSTNSVVSIVISKDLPVYEQKLVNPFGDLGPGFNIQVPQYVQNGTQLQEIGAGSGFIVSAGGLVLTNKHVVSDSRAQYTVFTNDGNKYSAKVLALDPVQDLAIVQIEGNGATFQPIKLGDSSGIQVGQTAIAIGNALGQFTNTVSVGVVSGLQRTVFASDQAGGSSETLQGTIQTDAAINSGNSGGPLLNLKGEVIGINTAVAQGAQSIGFAIPINMAKKDITQVQATNKIVYPFLGVRYILVDNQAQQQYNLPVNYGALVLKGSKGEPAITAGSAAATAEIQENDVILEIDGEKVTTTNPLSAIILKYNPGDKVTLKILRNNQEQNVEVVLGERNS
jgi:S1-C subfamily serine protease